MNKFLSTPLIDSVRNHIRLCLQSVKQNHVNGETCDPFRQAHLALECLPLTTAEFATAKNRLENARNYLSSEEPGAALYELRLLLRSLGVEESD